VDDFDLPLTPAAASGGWTRSRDRPGEKVTESKTDGTVDMQGLVARRAWPAEVRQLTAIRAEVRRWLGPTDLPDDDRDDLVLAVSEAATNAIEHGYRGGDPDARVEVALWRSARCLHIAVVDSGTWRQPTPGRRGRGFGLPLMRRLVGAVAVDHGAVGTRVVLEHPLARPVVDSGRRGAGRHRPSVGSGVVEGTGC
jgi:anti-sigma regulatory factor (Ser/Thr protein kinase)